MSGRDTMTVREYASAIKFAEMRFYFAAVIEAESGRLVMSPSPTASEVATRAIKMLDEFQRAASIGQAAPDTGEGSPPAPENCPDCNQPNNNAEPGRCPACRVNASEHA